MDTFKNSIIYNDCIVTVSKNGDCYVVYFKNDTPIIEKLTPAQQEQEWYRPILICLNQNIT